MRYISLIFIALGLIFISQESLGEDGQNANQVCNSYNSDISSRVEKLYEHCGGAGAGRDLEKCASNANTCEQLTFDEDRCLEESTLDRQSCKHIFKSSASKEELFEQHKCAELASQNMDGIRDELDNVSEDLRQAQSDLADANSSAANNGNGLMDAMKSIQEARTQANEQKMQAAIQRDEQIAQAQDQRRRALDAADEADLEIMKQQAEIRAKAAENAIKMASEISKLRIDCLSKAEEKLATERSVRNNAALGRALKEKSLGSMIGGNKRFEDRYNTYKNDCLSSEITSEKAKTLEIANNAAIVAAEEQMMITQQTKERAVRRLAGEELMAAEAMQRAQVNYDMAVNQADMAASNAQTQGMIAAVQGMVQPGGGVPGAGGNSQLNSAQANVAELRRERTILRCKQRCGALLGGRDRNNGNDDGLTPAEHLTQANAIAGALIARCGAPPENCRSSCPSDLSHFNGGRPIVVNGGDQEQ